VAEFRDPWALNAYGRKIGFLQFLERRLEKRVMKGSSLLIGVAEGLSRQLEMLHGKRVATIHNGFDEQDYAESVPLTTKFTITYTGQIYPGKRDPTILFEALKVLKDEGKISPDNLEVRLFGQNTLASFSEAEKYRLGELVKTHDLVPYKESVRLQQESTVLLLLEWNSPEARDTYTGKLFEYLAAKRPILAIAYKSGAVDNLLTESGTGIVINNPTMMKDVLSHWLDEWQKSGRILSHWEPRADVIQRYTRRGQAGKLAQLLEGVSGQ
jgi:hypothetical protein